MLSHKMISTPYTGVSPAELAANSLRLLPYPVLIIDHAGILIFSNRAMHLLLGYSEKYIAHTHISMLDISLAEKWEKVAGTTPENDRPASCEIEFLHHNGKKVPAHIMIQHVPVSDQTYYVCTIQPINELAGLRNDLSSIRNIYDLEYKNAKAIQQEFLPKGKIHTRSLDIAHRYHPLEAIGGDYYMIRPLQEGGIGIFLGDVCGHGVGAALLTAFLKFANDIVCRTLATSPAAYIYQLNNEVSALDVSMPFITGIYGRFYHEHADQLNFTFTTCGNPAPVLFRKRTGRSYCCDWLTGKMLGLTPDHTYTESTFFLEKGDRLFLFTDGLSEIQNEERTLLGSGSGDLLIDMIESACTATSSIEDTLETILKSSTLFRGSMPVEDDLTLLGFEVI